jgi:hypothetical protein
MTIKAPQQLRDLDALYRRIERCEPANYLEEHTRLILLELARVRRNELRRELVKPRIKVRKRVV